MKKLVQGIKDFKARLTPEFRDRFARLALEQKPDALFICCSDSRVAPNVFASTDPGDLFVIRNVGNLVPPCGTAGVSLSDESEAAAIEFAILNLRVRDIIVCGHSECGAMIAIHQGRKKIQAPHLQEWLRHGEPNKNLSQQLKTAENLTPHNLLSQKNVLNQIEHLKTYPVINDAFKKGELTMHAWWFDIAKAEVYRYEQAEKRFVEFK